MKTKIIRVKKLTLDYIKTFPKAATYAINR